MTSATSTAPVTRDQWLLPILEEVLTRDDIARLESAATESYWEAAVSLGCITDHELLKVLSRRAHTRIAQDLFVSPNAIEVVPETLARRYRILPLDASGSRLEIATANPYDADCERTLGFWSGRSVGISLAPPLVIAERIEEAYGKSRRSKRFALDVQPSTHSEEIEAPPSTTAQEKMPVAHPLEPVV